MAKVRALVLRAPGINCDEETAFAWDLAGAKVERTHINQLIDNPARLRRFQVFTLPGGFSYGDDIASGKVLALRLRSRLWDALTGFLEDGGLILGICNGFQVLVRLGLLPRTDGAGPVTLTHNESGHFEARWVRVRVEVSNCPFLSSGEEMDLPVAHAEGRVVTAGGSRGAKRLAQEGHVALRYLGPDESPAPYPYNPNGSVLDIAGLVDPTGRILGMMPHPERNLFPPCSPLPMADSSIDNAGRRLFEKAVRHLS